MEKMNTQQLESFLSENVKKGSQKVWRSNIKKIITLQNENIQVQFLNDLISLGKSDPRFSHLQDSTWHTIEKNTNSFLSWLNNQSPKVESPKVEESKVEESKVEESKSLAELEESLRIKQEESIMANKELKEKQEAEKSEREALAKAKKEELLRIAKEKAEIEARKKEGVIPKGKVLEYVQKEAVLSSVPSSKQISEESLRHEKLIPTESSYCWLDDERATIVGALNMNENLIVYGGAGIGKSTQFEKFCEEEKLPLIRIGSNSEAIPDDLYYSKSFIDNTVVYHAKAFVQAVEIANKIGACVLVFEEINANPESVMVAMHSMTDSIKSVQTDIGLCKLNKGCKLLVVGTANLGYAGTGLITQALESRLLPVNKKVPSKEFILANIWTEKVDLEIKEKLYRITELIEKSQVSKNHVFKIREPKQILKMWDSIPQNILLDSISMRWADNEDDEKAVKQIVQNTFC